MKSFKSLAAEKQKQFISGKVEFDKHFILKDSAAMEYQFIKWDGLEGEIEKRRKIKDKKGAIKMPFKNMLRSEHIPNNLFIPLKLSNNPSQVLSFFGGLLNRSDLMGISKFEIEWAPANSKDTLDDKTSFDTYIQFELPNSQKLGVGIEVKFTEKSYPFTASERTRLETQNDSSPYYKTWSSNGESIYNEGTYSTLGKKEYKQFFRNHLLGLSMLDNKNIDIKIDEFISLHLFPVKNHYQLEKANGYLSTIKPENQKYFKPITFEKFIEKGFSIFNDKEHLSWLEYLKARYVI